MFCLAVFNFFLLSLFVIITFTNFNRFMSNITLLKRLEALVIIYIYKKNEYLSVAYPLCIPKQLDRF